MKLYFSVLLCCNGGHSSALFSTKVADLGAFLAMFCLMFTTFVSAFFTDPGTNAANILSPAASQTH
jgi:hypothetical protein